MGCHSVISQPHGRWTSSTKNTRGNQKYSYWLSAWPSKPWQVVVAGPGVGTILSRVGQTTSPARRLDVFFSTAAVMESTQGVRLA
jgi:hypothetical protein